MMFSGIVLVLILGHTSPGFTLGLTAEMLAPVVAAPVLERVVPVYAPEPQRMKAGYYRNNATGVVSYYDGCNWCSLGGDGSSTVMGCTSMGCAGPPVVSWEPAK